MHAGQALIRRGSSISSYPHDALTPPDYTKVGKSGSGSGAGKAKSKSKSAVAAAGAASGAVVAAAASAAASAFGSAPSPLAASAPRPKVSARAATSPVAKAVAAAAAGAMPAPSQHPGSGKDEKKPLGSPPGTQQSPNPFGLYGERKYKTTASQEAEFKRREKELDDRLEPIIEEIGNAYEEQKRIQDLKDAAIERHKKTKAYRDALQRLFDSNSAANGQKANLKKVFSSHPVSLTNEELEACVEAIRTLNDQTIKLEELAAEIPRAEPISLGEVKQRSEFEEAERKELRRLDKQLIAPGDRLARASEQRDNIYGLQGVLFKERNEARVGVKKERNAARGSGSKRRKVGADGKAVGVKMEHHVSPSAAEFKLQLSLSQKSGTPPAPVENPDPAAKALKGKRKAEAVRPPPVVAANGSAAAATAAPASGSGSGAGRSRRAPTPKAKPSEPHDHISIDS